VRGAAWIGRGLRAMLGRLTGGVPLAETKRCILEDVIVEFIKTGINYPDVMSRT